MKIEELQLVTGVVTNDLDYLYYLLVKDGCYFNKFEIKDIEETGEEISFEEWFSNI